MDSYKMIRQQIISDIERGVYQPGDTIPKQIELAQKYQVSRGTIRKALDELIRRGVLITTKGTGTVVAELDRGYKDIYRPLSFSDSKRVEKKNLKSKVLEIKYIYAEPWLARQLQISVGSKVVFLRRVRILEKVPENYQCSYLSVDRLKGMEIEKIDLENGSLFEAIREKTGLYAAMKNEEIRAVHCPDFVAKELHIGENEPVVLVMRTVFGQDAKPLEYCEDYECTDIKGLFFTTRSQLQIDR